VTELGLPPERTNPNRSGISLGHPIGATSAILVAKDLYDLRRTGGRVTRITPICALWSASRATGNHARSADQERRSSVRNHIP
jgi:acetyl-CoA acetyltransferase